MFVSELWVWLCVLLSLPQLPLLGDQLLLQPLVLCRQLFQQLCVLCVFGEERYGVSISIRVYVGVGVRRVSFVCVFVSFVSALV